MGKPILEERRIVETVQKLRKSSFTILDFMETFKQLFPDEWRRLVERFGLFGEKRRYTVATYLANRLYSYSHKPKSCLAPFRQFRKGGKGDYRRTTDGERKLFGSPWIAIYQKRDKEET